MDQEHDKTEQDRAELRNKLRSRMNQSKMGRLNKNQKEQKMNAMKEKIIGDNAQMAEVFDRVVNTTKKKNKKKNKQGGGMPDMNSLQKDLEKTITEELIS